MHKPKELLHMHPFILFWLGVLTGAVAVSLLFFYKALEPTDYRSSSFKWNFKAPQIEQIQFQKSLYKYGINKHIEAVMGMNPDFQDIDKGMNPDFNTTDINKGMNPDF